MEQVRSPIEARRIGASGRTVVFHAGPGWHQRIRAAEVDFFTRLGARLTTEGVPHRLATAGGATSRVLLAQDHVHIMVGGAASYGPNILHAHPAYIWGFWYLDEVGIHWNSSIRLARFVPERIDAEKAGYFFNGVSGWMLRQNMSRLPQVERHAGGLEQAAAVIYCQDIEQRTDRAHFLTTEDMIRVTAETCGDRLVYVKPHPEQSKALRQKIIATSHDYRNVQMSNASVHDLNEAADMVVTQNSAAGFEALMQKKPVITCARSDFWHATLTPRTHADLREALRYGTEAMAGFEYEKFFYWFLAKRCLEPQKEDFASRAWARIRDKAYL